MTFFVNKSVVFGCSRTTTELLERTTLRVLPDVHDRYAEWHQREISQLVWAHPSIAHSHYKNPAGKVYTLSPWPMTLGRAKAWPMGSLW